MQQQMASALAVSNVMQGKTTILGLKLGLQQQLAAALTTPQVPQTLPTIIHSPLIAATTAGAPSAASPCIVGGFGYAEDSFRVQLSFASKNSPIRLL
jgi:hypothetical protein